MFAMNSNKGGFLFYMNMVEVVNHICGELCVQLFDQKVLLLYYFEVKELHIQDLEFFYYHSSFYVRRYYSR